MKLIQLILVLSLISLSLSQRNYRFRYFQGDGRWKNDKIGTSSFTIQQKGCLISCVAMALTSIGKFYNPKTLNIWLTNNFGYKDHLNFVWSSVNNLGLYFEGKVSNDKIKSHLEMGKVVILKLIKNHYVLAVSMQNNTIRVIDPGNISATTYNLLQVMNNQAAVFRVL